jgi:hypothetical protein
VSLTLDRFQRPSGRVPSAHLGQARLFLQAIRAQEPEADKKLSAIFELVGKRLRHKPTLRKEMVISTIRLWRDQVPSRFRLSFTVSPDGSVTEDRLVTSVQRPISPDDGWDEDSWESGLMILRVVLRTVSVKEVVAWVL